MIFNFSLGLIIRFVVYQESKIPFLTLKFVWLRKSARAERSFSTLALKTFWFHNSDLNNYVFTSTVPFCDTIKAKWKKYQNIFKIKKHLDIIYRVLYLGVIQGVIQKIRDSFLIPGPSPYVTFNFFKYTNCFPRLLGTELGNVI